MTQLGTLDWIVCAAYLLATIWLAIKSASGTRDNEDYFIGGRSMNWISVGVSMFATSFSSISFLGLPQQGAYLDFSFYLTILCIPLVITPVLWWVFVPLYAKLRVSSGYEYLGLRFGQPARRLGSVLYCIYAVGWMGAMLYAVALTLQVVLGLNDVQYYWLLIGVGAFATLYTVVGGLKAVIWTDVLQAVVMGGAVVVVLFLAVGRIEGGWGAFLALAADHEKFRMFHLDSNLLAPANFTERNSVFTAVAFGVFMYLPGYAVSQNMIQRYVCAGSLSAGRGIVVLSAGINTVLGFLFLLVGAALFGFYVQPGGLGLPTAGVEIPTQDQILPYFAATQLAGIGLVGLIVAGLFAAAMSSIDSGINGVTSVIVYDWLQGEGLSVRVSRMLTAALGVLVIGAAILAPVIGRTVIDIINMVAGTTLGMLLAIFLVGLFSPRANLPGMLCGVGAGTISLLLVWLGTDVPRWWYGAFTMVPVIVVTLIASRFFPAPTAGVLEAGLLKNILRRGRNVRRLR